MLTGKTIGQLTNLASPTSNTLFPVELSGVTYHIDFSSMTPDSISSGPSAPGSAVVANPTNVNINFSDGIGTAWSFSPTGITFPDDTIQTTAYTGVTEGPAEPLNYKVYTALLTQTGSNPPVASILENTIGGINYRYISPGDYEINSPGLFTLNKTFASISPNFEYETYDTAYIKNVRVGGSDSTILLKSYNNLDPSDDIIGFASQTLLEIRVYEPLSFISQWQVTSDLELPLVSNGTYSGTIDWGDGTTSSLSYANRIHNYANPGLYTITISGTIIGWNFQTFAAAYRESLQSILKWGPLRGRSNSNFGMFFGCSNLTLTTVSDTPDLAGVTSTANMFNGCTSLTNINRINEWNVSNVTTMSGMFYGATNFNQPLNSWDVSNVTNMSSMFGTATAFNQPLDNWDVSSVTTMLGMFNGAVSFNQPLDNWDVSSVTTMESMFYGTTNFNQPLNSWNVSSVTRMNGMFGDATVFNQPLDNWDVSSVTSMNSMFTNAFSFNQPLNSWNVSSVTNMSLMFTNAKVFNQPLNNWNVSLVSFMINMFSGAWAFNQDLSGWCVSLIPTEPSGFKTNTFAWVLPKPIWGTCPP